MSYGRKLDEHEGASKIFTFHGGALVSDFNVYLRNSAKKSRILSMKVSYL